MKKIFLFLTVAAASVIIPITIHKIKIRPDYPHRIGGYS